MRKSVIAIILVLVISVSAVAALDGFTFSAGIGYDFRNVKSLGDKANSMDLELGAKYPIGNGFSAYTDVGVRFVGKAQFGNQVPIKSGFYGINLRAGVLYGLRFVNTPKLETYIGGGLSFANTSVRANESFSNNFYNIGVGFKLVLAYRINDSLAISFTEMPDLYFMNFGSFCLGSANTTTLGALFKF